MLSRHQIRIKIFHCIYSSYTKHDIKEKELQDSFEEYKNLYFQILEILTYIKKRAEFEISHGLKKNIATKDDLNPNSKFINNSILEKIDKDIQIDCNEDEKKLIAKKIYSELKTKEYYLSYMSKKTDNISDDKKIIIKIINEELFNITDLIDYLENNSIYWNDDFFSVQLLLNKMINEFGEKSKKNYNFLTIKTFKNTEDEKFAKKLFSKTIKLKEKNNSVIHELAKNWDIERISTLDSILLQLAITEMTQFDSIPYKVSINEYIEIAKTYSTKKSHEFINGILDAFLKKNILI
jgi:N utilization substance protein B